VSVGKDERVVLRRAENRKSKLLVNLGLGVIAIEADPSASCHSCTGCSSLALLPSSLEQRAPHSKRQPIRLLPNAHKARRTNSRLQRRLPYILLGIRKSPDDLLEEVDLVRRGRGVLSHRDEALDQSTAKEERAVEEGEAGGGGRSGMRVGEGGVVGEERVVEGEGVGEEEDEAAAPLRRGASSVRGYSTSRLKVARREEMAAR